MLDKLAWMMDYCKRCGLPPAETWVWELAERKYNEGEFMNRYFVYYNNMYESVFEDAENALTYIRECIKVGTYPDVDSFDIIEGKLLKVFREIKFVDVETYNKLV